MNADAWELDRSKSGDNVVLQRATRDVLAPGPGEALVRIRACSLNARDVLQLDGKYTGQVRPFVVCSDAAGEVLAVGSDVKSLSAGDRVANHGLPGWMDGPLRSEKKGVLYGGPDDGAMTTHRLFPAATLLRLPDHLSYEDGATLNCAGLTAWSAVVTHSMAVPGDTLVIQGTGGVSLFALQFAKMAGLRTIITSSSDEKLEKAKGLGADHGVNYRDPDWPRRIRDLTGGGADAIVEVAGTIDQSVRALRTGGTVLSVGVLSDARPGVNLPMIVMRAIRLQGVTLGSLAEMQAMGRAMAMAELRPVIDRLYAFEAVEEAFEYYRSGAMFGKIVVTINRAA
jgi:NADPH:quinone reductase-like Zn-dependent oxidoreductase